MFLTRIKFKEVRSRAVYYPKMEKKIQFGFGENKGKIITKWRIKPREKRKTKKNNRHQKTNLNCFFFTEDLKLMN